MKPLSGLGLAGYLRLPIRCAYNVCMNTTHKTVIKDGIKVIKVKDRVWIYNGIEITWRTTWSNKKRYCFSFPEEMRAAHQQKTLEMVSFTAACNTIDMRLGVK